MRLFSFISVFAIAVLLVSSCKKSDNTPSSGKVNVTFQNKVGTDALTMGPIIYKNAAGNKFSVSLLKYYISDFTLVRADGSEYHTGNHKLIDASDPASCSFDIDSIANGTYTSVKFYLGVDSAHNHTGDQSGDLDPVKGMIWSWNTGYIFFKHEGNFIDSTGATKPLLFHLGTDRARSIITVPLTTSLSVSGNTRAFSIILDLASAYTSPGNINFDYDNNHMSTEFGEGFWISAMRTNLADAFKPGPMAVE